MPSNLDDLIEAARKCPPVEVVFTTPDPDDHCWVCAARTTSYCPRSKSHNSPSARSTARGPAATAKNEH